MPKITLLLSTLTAWVHMRTRELEDPQEWPERLRKAWKIFMTNHQGRVGILKEELKTLADQLSVTERIEDPLLRLFRFLSLIAPWHDRTEKLNLFINELKGVDWGQFTQIISWLEGLGQCFNQSGRNPMDRNRTLPGEPVSEERVFFLLGDYGVVTLAAVKKCNTLGFVREGAQKEALQFLEQQVPPLKAALARLLGEQPVP